MLCLLCLQLLGENLFNPPGLDIVFTDTQSLRLSDATKAALSIAPYKPSVSVPFNSWSTPVETPSGTLANEVPFDRNGVARQQGNILPGELCCMPSSVGSWWWSCGHYCLLSPACWYPQQQL